MLEVIEAGQFEKMVGLFGCLCNRMHPPRGPPRNPALLLPSRSLCLIAGCRSCLDGMLESDDSHNWPRDDPSRTRSKNLKLHFRYICNSKTDLLLHDLPLDTPLVNNAQ